MKQLCRAFGLLIILVLAGCVAPYTPPAASPSTAALDITVRNLFGHAALNIDTGVIQKQNLLTTQTVGRTVDVETMVETSEALWQKRPDGSLMEVPLQTAFY